MSKYKYCNHCEKVTPYEELCPTCGNTHARSSVRNVPDVLGFRPHYNHSLGEPVHTQKQMHESAARKGIEMRRF